MFIAVRRPGEKRFTGPVLVCVPLSARRQRSPLDRKKIEAKLANIIMAS